MLDLLRRSTGMTDAGFFTMATLIPVPAVREDTTLAAALRTSPRYHSLLCENTIRELPLNAANKRKDVFLHVETSRCVRVQVPASVDWVSCDTYEDPTVKKSPWPWDPSSSYSAIYNCGRNHAVYPWFLGLSCASMLTGAGSIPEAVAVKYVLQGKMSPSVYLPLGLTYGEFATFPGVGT